MALLHFLSSLPIYLMTFLVIALYLAFTILAFFGCKKFISNQHRTDHSDVIITISQSVGTLYGLLLASVAVIIITNRMDISHAIETEANSAADIALLSSMLPNESITIQKSLKDYLHTVKTIELEALKKGEIKYDAAQYLIQLQKNLLSIATPGPNESIIIQKNLDVLSDLYKARRTRIEGAQYSTHPYVWFVLVVGSLILIFCCAIFTFQHAPLYLFLLSLVGLSVGLIISLMIAFDKPFAGDVAIQPVALNESLRLLDELSSKVTASKASF